MGVTRRQALALTAGLAALPRAALAEAPPPPIFADLGVPDGPTCEQAIDHGADFLIAPVATTKDGGLVVAPDVELSSFTDVARRPEYADRRRDATIEGAAVSGWFTSDFTLAELKSLVTGPPGGGGRAAPPSLLSLGDVIDIARSGSVRQARVVGISPGLLRPAFHAARELGLERRLADAIRVAGYDWAAAAIFIQSREPAALKTMAGLSAARRIQLVAAEGGPTDPAAPRFQAMIEPDGLSLVKSWAGAIGPAAPLLIQPGPKGAILSTGLAAAAHAAGLKVYARAESKASRASLMALFLAGADGVMAADVGLAARARSEAIDRLRGGSGA
jgi:glycerophosphoryl diester phosphodiesterase